jgi:hypothetical protein
MAAPLQSSPPTSTCHKRKRSNIELQPLTPPLTASDSEGTRLVSRAVNVLSTAATALSQVTLLYESDSEAQEGLLQGVETITRVNETGGKLIVCGVGKSGLVGRKIVATMKSLGIACSFMHAAEALHGDLGDIRKVCGILSSHAAQYCILISTRTMPSSSYPTLAKQPSSSLFSRTFLRIRPSSQLPHTSALPIARYSKHTPILFCCPRQYMSLRR